IAGLTHRPLDDPRATIPLVAITARDHTTTQTHDFLHLLANHQRTSLLHPIPPDIDLTEPRHDRAPRVLQHAV
ncbi:MAG: hypothetical protein QOD57_2480, partial [Actinomycetota bacterium]|nr:hypothetical protein [Actinomycetota bacterium]